MPHNIDYLQVNAAVGVVGDNFPGTVIPFKFLLNEKWYPKKSFVKIRVKLTNGDGSLISLNDVDKAPNMNWMPNMFNNIQLIHNGKVISECSNYVAEIDTFKNRMMQSNAWLESGGTSNYWEPSQPKRLSQIASDGYISEFAYGTFDNSDVIVNANRLAQGFDAAAGANSNSIEFLPDGKVAFAINGGANLPNLNVIYKVGDTITYLAVVYTITAIQGGDDDDQVMVVSPAATIAAASNVDWLQNRAAITSNNIIDKIGNESFQRSDLEIPWRPTCGAFDVDELPQGEWVLQLTSNNNVIFQKRAIESLNADVLVDNTAAGIKVVVQSLELYVARDSEGMKLDVQHLKIGEIQCRKFNVDGSTSSQFTKQFIISPKTKSIALAFQDRLAGSNSLFSNTKFKIRPIAGNTDYPSGEMALSKISIRYNGQVKPVSTPFPRFGKPQDYISELYVKTMIYNGAYNRGGWYREGGVESKEVWSLGRGPYYHWTFINKPNYDRQEVDLTFQFDVDLDDNSAAGLLFNYFINDVDISNCPF